MAIVERHIFIGGMTCAACAARIERGLAQADGVVGVRASFRKRDVTVTYDNKRLKPRDIQALLKELGYHQLQEREKALKSYQLAGILLIIVTVWLLASYLGAGSFAVDFPLASSEAGYAALFLIGLLTSVHCVAMCGGINLSQCLPAGASGGDRVVNRGAGGEADGAKGAAAGVGATAGQDDGAATNSRFSAVAQKLRIVGLPSLRYNLGRLASYTLVGALVGALGSVLLLDGYLRGAVQLLAGVLMVAMGLSMLGVIPSLSSLLPRLPQPLASRLNARRQGTTSPLVVGLLTGLMPCGPLQAMQLYALGTGSALQGALAMFFFAAGTLPLMFGLGFLASLLSGRFTKKVMAAGACLVMLLGLMMFSSGWALSGLPQLGLSRFEPGAAAVAGVATGTKAGGNTAAGSSSGASAGSSAVDNDSANAAAQAAAQPNVGVVSGGQQLVYSTLDRGRYPAITVQAGIPVRWLIQADSRTITGCNNRLQIPAWQIQHSLKPGENVIEFTPDKPGTYSYSCWMGMIRSTIQVVED
ncbi:MAG: sulfite exporter TauE/SafE family protein [Coriobacteriales bacterium]|jgi:sulfite exporter TauE/SafE/copper chaperone CopZ/plastocyanin|nr:sulfite exporter TauE/SafE family protein [Coriobacteriales bacterium]